MKVYFASLLPLVTSFIFLLLFSVNFSSAQTKSVQEFDYCKGAENKNSEVDLAWGMKEQEGIQEYVVMRSFDGVLFEQLDVIKFHDTGEYSYCDLKPPLGTVHYLIKGIKEKESPVVSPIMCIKVGNIINSVLALSLFPNPVATNLNIEIGPREDVIRVSIKDANGTTLVSRPIQTGLGDKVRMRFNMASLPNGIYYVRFDMGASSPIPTYTECVMKQ